MIWCNICNMIYTYLLFQILHLLMGKLVEKIHCTPIYSLCMDDLLIYMLKQCVTVCKYILLFLVFLPETQACSVGSILIAGDNVIEIWLCF